nr:glycosyltransferase [Bacteroidota bacterium]
MNKSKVLVLTSSFPKGGGDFGGHFVWELTQRLMESFDMFVLAPRRFNLESYSVSGGIKIYRFKQFPIQRIALADEEPITVRLARNKLYFFVIPFFLFMQFIALVKLVRKEKIETIHSHWILPQGLVAACYKKLIHKNVKILATIHGSDMNGFNHYLGRLLKRFVLRNVNELTVVSNALKDEAVKLGYKKNIFVCPMGVDTKLFAPDKKDESLRERLKIEGDFILFAGNIIENKGVRFLIEAMPGVVRAFPDVKLVVAGVGELKSEMINLAGALEISDHILFVGAIPHTEMPGYLATADLFVFPSLFEGFGLALAEAMSCETLALSSNLKAVNDIIIDNESGLYFEGISSTIISHKIIHTLQNREKYVSLTKKGREHIVSNFDWNIVRKRYADIFNDKFFHVAT